jgi:hypothetical protein
LHLFGPGGLRARIPGLIAIAALRRRFGRHLGRRCRRGLGRRCLRRDRCLRRIRCLRRTRRGGRFRRRGWCAGDVFAFRRARRGLLGSQAFAGVLWLPRPGAELLGHQSQHGKDRNDGEELPQAWSSAGLRFGSPAEQRRLRIERRPVWQQAGPEQYGCKRRNSARRPEKSQAHGGKSVAGALAAQREIHTCEAEHTDRQQQHREQPVGKPVHRAPPRAAIRLARNDAGQRRACRCPSV